MGHGERYVGSLFRVDEPVPDDSGVTTPYVTIAKIPLIPI